MNVLGGIIALLLQDHRTISTKSVCNSQYMMTDKHWTTGVQIKHSTLSDHIRERRPEQNGLQFSAEDGKRRRVPNVDAKMALAVRRSSQVNSAPICIKNVENALMWLYTASYGITDSDICIMQSVLSTECSRQTDHVHTTPMLRELHWLPVHGLLY